MNSVMQDSRYAVRMLAKNRGFTAVAVLTLALGIGANTTIFSVINAVFLNALPVYAPDRLVNLFTTDAKQRIGNFTLLPLSGPNFKDYRDQNQVFEGTAAFSFTNLTITGRDEPVQVNGLIATGNYFDVLGVRAMHGRTFLPEDDAGAGRPVVVLSHGLWVRQFGADPRVVGTPVTMNGHAYTIIGVTPPGFKGLNALANPDLAWIPAAMYQQATTGFVRQFFNDRRALLFFAFGRLKPGVTMEEAEAALKTIALRLEQEYPNENKDRSVSLAPSSDAAVGINQRRQFVLAGTVLMVAVGLVLLIACVNLANLLLARAANREKEMGIRAALGAGRWRLVGQLLIESVVLAAAGGVVGLVIAYWGRDLLWSLRPPFFNQDALRLSLDARVLGFTAGLSVLTGVLFGTAPAIRISRPDVNDTLKGTSRGSTLTAAKHRLLNGLVVAEVALALVALIGAGLFVRSMQRAYQIDPGFDTRNIVLFGFNLGTRGYTPERGQQFYEQAIEKAKSVPGVESAAVSSNGILGGGFLRSVFLEGQVQEPGKGILVTTEAVSPGFFQTRGVRVERGRAFTEFDRDNAPRVAIVNEAMARRFWPEEDPIGKRFSFIGENFLREVVGVARQTAVLQIGEDPQTLVYLPIRQNYSPAVTLQARVSRDADTLLPALQRAVRELDRELALNNPNTIEEVLDQGLWAPRMGATLLALFGGLALLLSGIGIYGVMSYTVTQRSQEIGIRTALGAQPGDIVRMVIRRGMVLTAGGLAIGAVAGIAVERGVRSLLYGAGLSDVLIAVGVAGVLAAVALLACYLPARRAARVDAIVALRYE